MMFFTVWILGAIRGDDLTCYDTINCTGVLSEKSRHEILTGLLANYDKTERAQIDEQLLVTVDMYIQGVSSVNEVNMDYEVTMHFRQVRYLEKTLNGLLYEMNKSSLLDLKVI